MRTPALLDRWGNPVSRKELGDEVAAPTLTGVRSPVSGYPADGLNPVRLASILREADAGDPVRYLELAETIEERDPHYLGVLGTRRRSVSQIDISVEAASDDPADVAIADMIRDWLRRDELTEELFDILDCIGKGYSFTEIIWDTSQGPWWPERLEWRDPRWFRFDRRDLATPKLLSEHGQEEALPAFKFIFASIKAKSGLVLRSGLARAAAWAWMFKAFTQRDWAIFTQTYGQPLRLGKFGPNASDADKNTLFRAVANIAGDCAAIIPEGMSIEFIETGSVGQTADLYERRADWLDRQVSKAVLGQTATTDAVTGGLGSGKEHRQVQEDIERADARALAAILNRDLIRPWIDLEFGPQKGYPRIVIARPEKEDLKGLVEAVASLVPLGLRVEQSEMRDRLGLSDPAAGSELLRAPAASALPVDQTGSERALGPAAGYSIGDRVRVKDGAAHDKMTMAKTGVVAAVSTSALGIRFDGMDKVHKWYVAAEVEPAGQTGMTMKTDTKPDMDMADDGSPAAQAIQGAATAAPAPSPVDVITERLAGVAGPVVGKMLAQIEAMLAAAGSLEEFRAMLGEAYPDIDADPLTSALSQGFLAAHLAGRAGVEDESA